MQDDADTAQISLPLFQAYHPTTFLERGVAVPFTTPALAGARARPAERAGTEILVRNPAGGRGVYILPWGGICQLCRPTVHDTLLNQRVEALRSVTPEAIRRVARALAAEGLAGREASAAAARSEEADRTEKLVTNFHLLLALIEQAAPAELSDLGSLEQETEALKARAKQATARIAPRLGRTPEAVADALEELAELYLGLGAPGQQPPPRLIRLLAALRQLRQDMAAWKESQDGESAMAAEMIGAVADVTLACAERTIADAHALLADMPELLRRFQERPQEIATLIARPAWLLDGWEQICLVWSAAGTDAVRRAALFDMALQVPVLPREASEWVGTQVDTEMVWRFRRSVRRNEDWRTGATLDLIAASEHRRAMAI
ncbi:MAG TPA: hypothetical protein VFA03_04740 [Acetobacteraceae bacterium]|nr:hypothetical protein [Acetobacteraceae bacterium]